MASTSARLVITAPEFGGPVFATSRSLRLGWQWNVWSATLFNRYQSRLSGPEQRCGSVHQQGSRLFGIRICPAQYRGFKGLTLQAGILNVFDQGPAVFEPTRAL